MNSLGLRRLASLPLREWGSHPEFQRLPFVVGGPLLTLLFWTIFAIFVVAVWLSPVMPFGDFNYHLALAALLRRMITPGSPERQLYETNLISYNSFFQIAVAGLSFVFPVARAGQIVFCGFWMALSLSVLALLRALKQPTERAFILFPLLLTVPAAWGFANYCWAISLQLYALARVIRRPRVGASIGYDVVTGAIALIGMLAHLFGTGVVYVYVLITLIVRTVVDPAPFVVRYLRTLREGAPFLPPVAVAAAIFRYQQRFKNPDPDYLGEIPAFSKIQNFFAWGWDFFADRSDHRRLHWALLLLPLYLIFRARRNDEPYPSLKGWFFAAAVILYLVTPEGFFHVAVLFQRLPFLVILFAAIAMPRAQVWIEKAVAAGLTFIGFHAAFSFYGVRRAELPDLRDLTRVIAEAPPGRRLSIHAPYSKLEGQRWNWAGHLSPFYVVQKGLESANNYATKPSMPVHYGAGGNPPVAPDAVAQGSMAYNAAAPYAKRFDLVLVRTLDQNPAPQLWHDRAGEVDLLSHHGNWWLFDARRYFHNP